MQQNEKVEEITNNTFNGMKVAKGLDPNKIISKSIFLYNEPNRQFEKHGHLLYPLVGRNHRATLDTSNGNVLWQQELAFKKILNESQARNFYPFEEVSTNLTDLFNEKLKDTGMHIVREYSSHGDFSHYWECLSDRFDIDIKDSFRVGDTVQVGMVVRNGIGTSVALGIDLFTNCVRCSNGAIARGKDLGSIAIAHASSFAKMKHRFEEAIPIVIEHVKGLISYYQRSAYVRMNQEIAEQLYLNLHRPVSDGYYPDYLGIDTDERKRQEEKDGRITDISKIVHYRQENIALWQAFNDLTSPLWKSQTLGFTGKRTAEIALHRQLIKIVDKHGSKAAA